MTKALRQLVVISAVITMFTLTGCFLLPGGQVVESATVVYTAGSKKHTAAAQIPVEAPTVFAALVDMVKDRPGVVIDNRNDDAFLIEVSRGNRSLTGQATKLGPKHTLLYVWVDAGDSGLTGEELATDVVESVCHELGVEFELVNY
jgi:hypothetical protein